MALSRFAPWPLLALLCGCASGPDYQAPPVKPAQGAPFLAAGLTADTSQGLPDPWWRLYDDPVLDGLIRRAFAANTDLRVATADLERAEGLRQEARAALLPSTEATAGASFGRSLLGDSIAAANHKKAPDEWTKTAGFSVAYEVDLFGRVSRSIEAATADAEASAATRDSVRLSVAAQVARAYAEICAAGDQLAVARDSLDIAIRSRDLVLKQREAGATSSLDVVRAIGLVELDKAALPAFEGRQRSALYQLAALLGLPPAEAPAEAAGCKDIPHLKSALPIGDGSALLARRPDIRQAERRLAAASARIGVATADLYPRITFAGSITDIQNRQLTGYPGISFAVGPLISWDIPNLAVAHARILEANAADAAALAQFDGSVLQALKETEQALSLYGSEIDRNLALRAAKDRAEQALALADSRRAAGALSFFELLTVQQTLTAANAAVAASDAQLIENQIDVFRALGGGWQVQPARPQ
jgi:NodT family efflux transporter outer membrane factor (OMF) lipoprotein